MPQAEDNLLEGFPQTSQLRGRQVLWGAGPSSSSFCLSVALSLPGLGLSCSWCCRDVYFELFLVLQEYIVPGFDLEKLRLQSIITPTLFCVLVQPLVSSVPHA